MAEKTKFAVRTDECRHCRFYDILTDVQSKQQTGICRRHPPATFAQAVPNPTPQGVKLGWNYTSMWTMVKDSDWCGDFERKLDS